MSTKGRAPRAVGGGDEQLGCVHALERAVPNDGFDQHQRQRKHITPWARRAVAAAELLGRPIARGERLQRRARLFEGFGEALRFAHHFGDAEIEHFQRSAPAHLGDEQIGWLDVAVCDALLVRERQCSCGAVEQLDRGLQRAPAEARVTALRKIHIE